MFFFTTPPPQLRCDTSPCTGEAFIIRRLVRIQNKKSSFVRHTLKSPPCVKGDVFAYAKTGGLFSLHPVSPSASHHPGLAWHVLHRENFSRQKIAAIAIINNEASPADAGDVFLHMYRYRSYNIHHSGLLLRCFVLQHNRNLRCQLLFIRRQRI